MLKNAGWVFLADVIVCIAILALTGGRAEVFPILLMMIVSQGLYVLVAELTRPEEEE